MIAASCLLGPACSAGVDTHTTTLTRTLVPGIKTSASFDWVEIDQSAHRLYATDRSDVGVDVFDVSKVPATYVTTVALPATPNGLAVAPEIHRVFAGLSDGTVQFIDTTTEKVVNQVASGTNSIDLIEYAAQKHAVYAANGGGKVVVVDVDKAATRSVFNFGPHTIEQPRYNPGDGLLYVASPDEDGVLVVDPDTGAVKNKLPFGACRGHGMAIDPKHNMAVIACSSWVIRQNLHDPSDQKGFPQVSGGDIVTYDAKVDRFFVGSPDAKPSEVAVLGGNPIDFVAVVTTGGFGNSAAYDETNDMVYTPDIRKGEVGVIGFKRPTGDISLSSIPPVAIASTAALFLAIVVIMFAIGRNGDPVRRPAPQPARRSSSSSSRREQTAGEVRAGARRWTRKVEPPG
ncbi:MAG TPA: hypothetical protein VNA65_06410 [Candidatus Dormibacteraeota bacterium]|nr:hypothetical protein [Candidatus Dormibacteraeota bacterium]